MRTTVQIPQPMDFSRFILIGLLFGLISAVNYCKLCEDGTHTLCQYKKGPGKSCVNYKKIELTPGDKKYIVDIHNDIRHHVASGQETRGALGSQPPAADMLMLQWDNELAEIAQRWADQCIQIYSLIQHDVCKKTQRFEVGQNILTAVTTDAELPELSILILNWYKQVVNVIPTDIDYFSGIRRGKFLIGQYTQLVWATTKYVGCGIAAFKEHNFTTMYHHRLVCNYGPAGNIIGQAVYKRGTPCTRCPYKDCNKLRNNLCQASPNNKTDTKTDIKEIPSDKKLLTMETNTSIFSNNTKIFNTKINSSFCLNPDEFHNTTHIKYTKCIIGIGTNLINKTNVSISTTTTTTQTSSETFNLTSAKLTKRFLETSLTVKPTPLYHDPYEDVAPEEDRIIVYLSEPSTKISYAVGNGTIVNSVNRHRHYQKTRFRSSHNFTGAASKRDEVVLRNEGHFLRANGTWRNGHCRCNRVYRSHSNRLDLTYFSLLPIVFVYLHANRL